MAPVTSPAGVLTWATLGIMDAMALLGTGFIIVVNGHQWLQSKKMVPCKFLLASLSTSRFLLQMVSATGYFMYLISEEIQKANYLADSRTEVVNFIWMFSNMASLWSATWLAVFSCVKVANFANRLFIWLKPRINALVPRLLGMSIIVSMVFLSPTAAYYFRRRAWCNSIDGFSRNSSQWEDCKNIFTVFNYPQFFLASVNCSMTLSATSLLLTSLWQHVSHLKQSGAAFQDLSTQLHIQVMMPLLVSSLFYVLYCSSFVVAIGDFFEFGRIERMASDIALALYAFVHSMILILTNPELKKVAASMLNVRQRAS